MTSKASPTETELVQRAREGDRLAFEHLVHAHQMTILKFLASRVSDVRIAEELVQETFVRAYGALPSLSAAAGFAAWLFGIARNCLYAWYRERGKELARMTDDPESIRSLEAPQSPDDPHRLDALKAAYQSLNEDEREVLRLRFEDNRSCADIAARRNEPLGTIVSRLARAFAKLRREISRLHQEKLP